MNWRRWVSFTVISTISGIDNSKEYYLAAVRKENSLLQVYDAVDNIISQYYPQQTMSGIQEVILTPRTGQSETFKALINWDAIGSTVVFNKKQLHINKKNVYSNSESLQKSVEILESNSLNAYQKSETIKVNQQFNGEGIWGLDQSKSQYFDGKILAMWGDTMPDYPLYINCIRNTLGTYGVLIQMVNGNDVNVAQYAINPTTAIKTGIEDIILNPTSNGKLTYYMTVNWDNITVNFPSSVRIQVLELPKEKHDTPLFESVLSIEKNAVIQKDRTNRIYEDVYDPLFYDDSSDTTLVDIGFLIDAWNVDAIKNGTPMYLRIARNTTSSTVIFYATPDDLSDSNQIAYFYSFDGNRRTGVEDLEVQFRANSGENNRKKFKIRVNWDKISAQTTTNLVMNIDWLRDAKNSDAFNRIYKLEKIVPQYNANELYLNVFGDVIPTSFKKKWFDIDNSKDLEILLLGDSVVGLLGTSGSISDSEAMFLPPSMDYYHWTWGLWDRIVKNRPVYDRLDSMRDGVETFVKTGIFEKIISGSSKLDTPSNFGEHSVAANTYQSNAANAAVQFTWDLGAYEKLNIIHSLNPDGAPCKIVISGGNGNIQVSTDKSTWVEANGFIINQNSNPNNLTETECDQQGHALHQRHRRIWMRKVSVATGVQTVTFGRTDADETKYMYFWGTERWNQSTVIIQNIGRGGRTTALLNKNISDVADRNPDLVIHSLSLANEYKSIVGTPDAANASMMRDYNDFFFGGNSSRPSYIKTRSMLTKSENYTKFAYLVVMPHGFGTFFSDNNAINLPATNDMMPYLKYRKMAEYVKETGKEYDNLSIINMYDQLIHEGRYRGMTIEQTFGRITEVPGAFTDDTIHLNKLGSLMWTKYLSPIFDVI